MGRKTGTAQDDKWFNNLFVRQGLNQVKTASGYESDYNVFLEGAQKSAFADQHSIVDSYVTGLTVKDMPLGAKVSFSVNDLMFRVKGPLVNADLVGIFATVGQTIEDRYGHAVAVDSDINGKVYVSPPCGNTFKTLYAVRTLFLSCSIKMPIIYPNVRKTSKKREDDMGQI